MRSCLAYGRRDYSQESAAGNLKRPPQVRPLTTHLSAVMATYFGRIRNNYETEHGRSMCKSLSQSSHFSPGLPRRYFQMLTCSRRSSVITRSTASSSSTIPSRPHYSEVLWKKSVPRPSHVGLNGTMPSRCYPTLAPFSICTSACNICVWYESKLGRTS